MDKGESRLKAAHLHELSLGLRTFDDCLKDGCVCVCVWGGLY